MFVYIIALLSSGLTLEPEHGFLSEDDFSYLDNLLASLGNAEPLRKKLQAFYGKKRKR